MKTAIAFLLAWTLPLAAAPLDDYLRCAAELLPQSQGKLQASRRAPGMYATASHTEVFVYAQDKKGARAITYTLPERGILADNGDRAYFVRLPGLEAAKPYLLTVLQTEEGNWLDENALPNADDEHKYSDPVALAETSEALDQLRRDVFARLRDLPRYRADFNRRFSKNQLVVSLNRCEAAQDAELKQAVAAAKQAIGEARALTSEK